MVIECLGLIQRKGDRLNVKLIHGLILFALLMGGCADPAGDQPSSRARIELTHMLPTDQPTTTAIAICPVITDATLPERPAGFLEFERNILFYFNTGGDPAAISDKLLQSDYLFNPQVSMIDLNGDGVEEIAVMAHVALDAPPNQEGGIIVFYCSDGEFVSFRVAYGGYFYQPEISAVQDVDADGDLEIIFTYSTGGTGCNAQAAVVGFDQGSMVDYFDEISNTPHCKFGLSVEDGDDDGFMEIAITGSTASGTQATYARQVIYTYTMGEGEEYSLASTDKQPSPYRIHVLEDAQIAFDKGDYLLALYYYQQAAYSQELMDAVPIDHLAAKREIPGFESHPHEYQTAIAFFRMVAVHLLLGEPLKANEVVVDMEQIYPAGTVGSEFIDFARILIDEFDRGKSPVDACISVTEYIMEVHPNLAFDIGSWGAGNIYFYNEDICPFQPAES